MLLLIIAHFSISDCAINIAKDIGNPQPLLLNSGSTAFLFPQWNETSGLVFLSPGETINLYCPNGVKDSETRLAVATCIGGKEFRVDGGKKSLKNVKCKKHPWITVKPQKFEEKRSYCQGRNLTDVGFHVNNGGFLKTMSICHDIKAITTFYTIYQLHPYNVAYQKGVGRPGFIQAKEFNYSVDINKLYSKENQRKRLEILLGEDEEELLDEDDEKFFLSRGHLGGKVDFLFANHQRSTFFYLNAAPQWQVINGGNWLRVEDGIRRFVAKENLNATIISGVHEVLRFPNLEDGPFFLGEKKSLPVPQYFYKLVHDEESGKGIVFVSVNNPFIDEEETKDYIFCEKNVIKDVKWVTLRKSTTQGFVFACEVNDFMKEMPENLLPKLNVTGLL